MDNETQMFLLRLLSDKPPWRLGRHFSSQHHDCHIKTHDGSMVLLYMVCHGSHQYTPFMFVRIYTDAHHGSVMGNFVARHPFQVTEML